MSKGNQDQDQDKSEQATPFKLREARKRGQVSKSLDMNSFLMLAVGSLMVYFIGETLIAKQLMVSKYIFSHAHAINFDAVSAVSVFEKITTTMFAIFWPLIAVILVVGIAANFAQTGPVFSFFPLKPDMDRLNPVSGFKRIFSMNLIFQLIKSLIKFFLFATIMYFVIGDAIPSMVSLMDIDVAYYPQFLMSKGGELVGKLMIAVFIIAILDLVYSRWQYSKKMRMSRRDIKDEVKRREGDPHIRARQRELQKEAAKRSGSIQRVPEADVLITNPTHLSVALLYKRGEMQSPQVIAKGAGDLAMKMRQVARKHRIPIVENKRLARTLFKEVDIDHSIPEKEFPVVAKILVWVFALRERNINSTAFAEHI